MPLFDIKDLWKYEYYEYFHDMMYVVADYRKAAKRILLKIVEKAYNWIDALDNEEPVKEINANIPAVLNAL